jgi:GT2 family glycosyltransferase
MEIFFLSHNRREFTEATIKALLANTDWGRVSSVSLYDDNSTDGTAELVEHLARRFPSPATVKHVNLGGPVACMNDYVTTRKPEMFCKIDSDTMVPPGWLGDCLSVMERHPWLDILGIEAMRPAAVAPYSRDIDEVAHIGGIGLMRGRVFQYSLPRPDGRFGFTAWQEQHPTARKAWLRPALPVFLLDRLPMEPWASLSREYVAKGWQRHWPPYGEKDSHLWEWWTK